MLPDFLKVTDAQAELKKRMPTKKNWGVGEKDAKGKFLLTVVQHILLGLLCSAVLPVRHHKCATTTWQPWRERINLLANALRSRVPKFGMSGVALQRRFSKLKKKLKWFFSSSSSMFSGQFPCKPDLEAL